MSDDMLTEMAREMDKLRARLRWCEELLERTSTGERVLADAVGDADKEIASLKAENARLRGALERIMRCTDDFCAEDVARAALKGSDK